MNSEAAPRRTLLVDAAIAVLAAEGGRGLTHRAIDRHLGLPLGSTANYFGKRDELFHAVAERLLELDMAALGPIPTERVDKGNAANLVAATILQWLEPELRMRQLARHELLLQSVRDKQLRADVQRVRADFVRFAAMALRATGCTSPDAHAPGLVALYDGIYLDQLFYADQPAELDAISSHISRFLDRC